MDSEVTTTEATTDTAVETPAAEPAVETPAAPVVEVVKETQAPTPAPVASDEDDTQVFTAEDVTRMIQARVGRMQKQHEKELAEAKSAAGGKSLADAEAKAAAAEARIAEVETTYAIRFAAVAAGVPADQTDAIVKLADATGVRGESGVDAEKVAEAVKVVLDRYPGLAGKAETPAPTATPAPGVGGGPAQADPQKQDATTLMDAVIAKLGG